MLMEPSGTTRSGSISCVNPRPWQAGQAPWGVLKLKMRGSISGSEMPQWMQANFSLKVSVRASSPASSTSTRPSARGGGGLDGVGEPPPQALLHDEPVDDHVDVVLELLVELDVFLELAHLAVDLDAGEAVGAELLEELAVLALAPAHDRRDHAEARALLELADLVDDLLHALPGDGPPALRAVRVPDAGVEQAQVVVDLGDRAHGGPRVAGGRLLVDGDGRRETLDAVHVRLVHLAEELARVGGEALDVAALALGVDGVEGERRLARAGEAGDDDEAVARQPQGDVLEVVLAGAVDDEVAGHGPSVSDVPGKREPKRDREA